MLIVRLYRDVSADQKPEGIPDEWPAELLTVEEGTSVPDGCIAMSPEEYDAYLKSHSSLYQAWRDALDLPILREEKFASIDRRTSSLIDEGFIYDGKVFSLSMQAQATYGGFYMLKDEALPPVTVNALNDLDTITLLGAEQIRTFYLAAVATYRAHLDSGITLKSLVRKASTVAEVEAVVDER